MATVSCTEGSLKLSALSPAGAVVSTGVLEAGQVAVIVGGIITISAITAAVVGSMGSAATTSSAGTAAAATTATAATAGISTTAIVGVAAGVAAVGVAGAAASGGGGGGGGSTPTPTPAPASTTYDATGTWTWTDTYAYDSCMPAEYRTGIVTIYQTGNTFTGIHVHGGSFSGTVSGATYTGTGTHPEGDGITKDTLTFTLSSSTTGTYTNNFQWTDGTHTCSGVHKGTASKNQ